MADVREAVRAEVIKHRPQWARRIIIRRKSASLRRVDSLRSLGWVDIGLDEIADPLRLADSLIFYFDDIERHHATVTEQRT